MTIIHRVFAVFTILAAIGFMYLAARTLKTHQEWRNQYNSAHDGYVAARNQIQELKYGKRDDAGGVVEPGILQLKETYHKWSDNLGRVWRKVKWGGPEGNDSFKLVIDELNPGIEKHHITVDQILYVFDDRDPSMGGQYVGQFKVTAAPATQPPTITLTPVQKGKTVRPQDFRRLVDHLQASGKADVTFTLFDVLPADSGVSIPLGDGVEVEGAFTDVSEDKLKAWLPAESLPEYLKDGKPAAADDPAEFVDANKIYHRPIRAYPYIFAHFDEASTELEDETVAYKRDTEEMVKVNEDLAKEAEYFKTELAAAKAVLEKVKGEVAAVAAHQEKLEMALAEVKQQVAAALEKVKQQETELEKIYAEALRKHDAPEASGKPARTAAIETEEAEAVRLGRALQGVERN